MQSLPETPFLCSSRFGQNGPRIALQLMELELIEPCLYFRFDKKSPSLFAEMRRPILEKAFGTNQELKPSAVGMQIDISYQLIIAGNPKL